jgi:hypothetical protein
MTNDLAVSDLVKILFGLVLMGVWVFAIWGKLVGAEDLVAFCKLGLTGLAAHYLTNYGSTPAPGSTVITTGASK